MTNQEAIAECKRWLVHLDQQQEKSVKLQELARMAKIGPEHQKEAQRQLRQIDRTPTVYDGANLRLAVEHLIEAFYDSHIS